MTISHGNNLTPPAGTTDPQGPPAAWEIFTRLLHDLETAARAEEQILEALESVHQATGAGVVCWYNERTNEILGTPDSGALGRCRSLIARLLGQVADGRGSFQWQGPPGKPGALQGACGMRAHPSRPGWIVALAFDGNCPLASHTPQLITLAAAMLLKQGKHSRTSNRLKDSLLGLVRCLTTIVDARDPCTAGHSERVSRIAVRLGRELGLPTRTLSDLHLAGLLHDIGKVALRDDVLFKAGRLTPEEMDHIRTHPVIGDQIVATITPFARLRPGVRNHHERHDGKGYPDGLAGDNIPLLARVLAVADSCDAMMSARRYRQPIDPEEIDAILREHSGTQWDPVVVQAFLRARGDIYPPAPRRGVGESVGHAIADLVDGLKDGSTDFYTLSDGQSDE